MLWPTEQEEAVCSLKSLADAVETEQMVGQELGQAQRQVASVSLGSGL